MERRQSFLTGPLLVGLLSGVPAPLLVAASSVAEPSLPLADTLRGRVLDRDRHPLEGVEVLLPELNRVTLTGMDGRFALPAVPPGEASVVFRRVGYESRVERVSVPISAPLDVELSPTPFKLPGFTVTATRRPMAVSASPLPATVLQGEPFSRTHSVSLSKTVEALPGVRTLSTGEQIGKPVIRGNGGARVLVLEDGMRLEDYSWSDEDGPSVDARLADRVEVIRGPASVLYGSEALGGVLNVVPEAVDGASFLRRNAEAYFASNNLGTGGILTLEGASGPWGWRAVGIGRFAEDLRTPRGKL